MDRTQKLVIEVDPLQASVVLKQEILGVISRKRDLSGRSVSGDHPRDKPQFVHFKRPASEGVLLRRDR